MIPDSYFALSDGTKVSAECPAFMPANSHLYWFNESFWEGDLHLENVTCSTVNDLVQDYLTSYERSIVYTQMRVSSKAACATHWGADKYFTTPVITVSAMYYMETYVSYMGYTDDFTTV